MKKVLLAVLILTLTATFFLGVTVTAAAEGEGVSPYTLAEYYAEKFPARDILSGGEKEAATYLADCLGAIGYDVKTNDHDYLSETDSGKVTYRYRHVLGGKDNGKGKTVVIGCYYGGYAVQGNAGSGQGATVALSVGTLLAVAKNLYSLSLDYDLVIAFWGGMEVSDDFKVKECGIDQDKIALYIHLDGVAAGTSEYLYADEITRSQEKYFREIIDAKKADILPPPAYKKPLSLLSDDAFSYAHPGLIGVNRFFMGEGIPCIDIFGGAWSFDCGLYRYDGNVIDLEGTAKDTLAEINTRNGGKEQTEKRLNAVAEVVAAGVSGKGLSAALDRAAKEKSGKDLDSSLALYLITFIGSAILIGLFIFLILKQGKDRKEEVWDKAFNPYEDKPADPFDEFRSEGEPEAPKELPPEEKQEDEDDIFKF